MSNSFEVGSNRPHVQNPGLSAGNCQSISDAQSLNQSSGSESQVFCLLHREDGSKSKLSTILEALREFRMAHVLC